MVENVIGVLQLIFTLVVKQRPLVAGGIITASKEEVRRNGIKRKERMCCINLTRFC